MRSERARHIGGYVVAIATLALGVGILIGTASIPVSIAHSGPGPKLFPYLIGAGLIVVGLVALREAIGDRLAPLGALEFDLWPVGLMAAGLIVQIALIEPLGWIPSTTVLFAVGARAFGSHRLMMDLLLGFLMSAFTFALFDLALGLDLPAGDLLFG